ncbi:MAG: cytochrome c biogenesis protein CcsA [Chitinophagaceae bacterium]|nr:cytochrome c biogenesis protein CcsA [Chitinophagaceae bacterium]
MHKSWWKVLSIILLFYTVIAGFLSDAAPKDVNFQKSLGETYRNLYFHVCMWFAMMILFTISVVNAIKYLRTFRDKYDIYSRNFAVIGIVFGVLGYATGMIWSSFTWADPNKQVVNAFSSFARDPKLIGAAIALLVYFAYLILRDSIQDMDKRARISSVYNIFAYAILFPAIWILPRILPSLHPGGSDGNPALDPKDSLGSGMRLIFYPAVIGWTLLGIWIATLKIRTSLIKEQKLSK